MESNDHNLGESNNIYINQLAAALEGFLLLENDPMINRAIKNKSSYSKS